MIKKTQNQKPKTIETFFGKFYIVIFAVIMFLCAFTKLMFTLTRASATGVWKFILIFDTITTLITAASLFLFYISSDTKSKTGTKIAAVTFLCGSVLTVFTQFCVLLYYMSISFSVVTTMLTLIFFSAQSLFMLYFAIRLTLDVFKGKMSAKGALSYAGAKAFSLLPIFVIRFVNSELLDLAKFKTPFLDSNAMQSAFPEIAFITAILGAASLVSFALLYNKFANDCAKEFSDEIQKNK